MYLLTTRKLAELRKAIESGNHELANALELALKKA